MPHSRTGQVDLVPSPEGRVGHKPGPDAAYRRAISGDAVLRIAPDTAAFAASGHRGRTRTCAAVDAQDGADGDLPEAQDQSAASRAQDLSVSAARPCDQAAGSGVVRRHHLCSHAAWFPLPGGGHGLAQPGRAVLAAVQLMGSTPAMNRYGVPEIFNTDQGSQFTSLEFTQALKDAGVAISMDGKGRWMDNVFIERLWRSLKWECVYLRELETGSQWSCPR